jgi:molybdopterin-binding protein
LLIGAKSARTLILGVVVFVPGETRMLSARNRLDGEVVEVETGDVTAEVVLDVGGEEVAAVITRESAENLEIEVGMELTAVVKATDVMLRSD